MKVFANLSQSLAQDTHTPVNLIVEQWFVEKSPLNNMQWNLVKIRATKNLYGFSIFSTSVEQWIERNYTEATAKNELLHTITSTTPKKTSSFRYLPVKKATCILHFLHYVFILYFALIVWQHFVVSIENFIF